MAFSDATIVSSLRPAGLLSVHNAASSKLEGSTSRVEWWTCCQFGLCTKHHDALNGVVS